MSIKKHSQSIEIGGKTLTLSVGELALQSTVSVFATWGETTLLAITTVGKNRTDIDYFPLSVEYVEKLYAGGIIKGSRWVKREGKPTDDAILKGRLIDRSIRPLFPKSYRREVQVVINLLSVDNEIDPDVLASIAVSASIHLSNAPWSGPTATSRVGYIANELIVHPTIPQMKSSSLDLVATSVGNKINMIETRANILENKIIEDALSLANAENGRIIEFINKFREAVGLPKDEFAEEPFDNELLDAIQNGFATELDELIRSKSSKENNDPDEIAKFVNTIVQKHPDKFDNKIVSQAIDYLVKKIIRQRMLQTRQRLDGRRLDEVRKISSKVGLIPRIHGCGLFQRGDTQVISIATLAAPNLTQLLEGPEGQEEKRYMHHYNFPPYSVGEVGRVGFTNRREIGHGALAEKAIEPVLPDVNEFPYTIRVVSEVLGSNGSTSMASTCGSSLALMDAGVPIKEPVAGIAMGIMSNSDEDYMILTDIVGIEDFSGEMDFKVTATRTGITAIQLDVKNMGLTNKMIREVLAGARKAINGILDEMQKTLPVVRPSVSKHAPKIIAIPLPEDKIGEIIGPGGKMIRSLIAKFEVEIDVQDDGKAVVSGVDQTKVEACAKHIANMVRDIMPGEKFTSTVTRVESYGVFVEILPGKQGLIHVSRLSPGNFIKDASQVVKVGDVLDVEVYEVDELGRINIQPIKPIEIPEHIRESSDMGRQSEGPRSQDRRFGSFGHGRNDSHGRRNFGGGDRQRKRHTHYMG
jgi:polyribonucleotide nucleotidyltransferase